MRKILFIFILIGLTHFTFAQNKELKFNLNQDGSHYLKATFTGQVWIRETFNNPGSTIGTNAPTFTEDQTFDIGIRRARAQLFGKISDKVFLYTQFGTNNMTYDGPRKQPMFFHDVVLEYDVTPRALQIGAGLNSWNGLARYTSLAIAGYIGFDGPLYQQSTNDATDQFFRRYSVYAKGKIGKFDYRVNLAKPMTAQQSSVISPLSSYSDYSMKPPKPQVAGYFMYQFLDEESNLIPFMSGSYLGKKKVFTIGAGFQYQKDAMWHKENDGDTAYSDMINYNVDVFYDRPLGTNRSALTVYGAYTHYGFGPKYLRYNGVMNPATGSIIPNAPLNSYGNAFPMLGTGDVFYGQVGYVLPQSILGEKGGQLQPYADIMYANYDHLNDKMIVWEAGCNWLIEGIRSKISLGYQDRPVYNFDTQKESSRRGMIVLAYQIAI